MLIDSGSKSIDPTELQKIDVSNNLLNFLKSQVTIDGSSMTVSNLINLWYYDKSNSNLLNEQIKRVFTKIYGECYYFTISEGDNIILTNGIFVRRAKEIEKINFEKSIDLPVFNKDLHISLDPSTYYLVKDHKVCGINE